MKESAFELLIEQAQAEGFEYVSVCSDHTTAYMVKDCYPEENLVRLIGKRADGVHQFEDTVSHMSNAIVPWVHTV